MLRFVKTLRSIRQDEEGATLLEFTVIAPVFLFMLLGTFEIGYGIYMRSALNGAIQHAAREATLQEASDPESRRQTDNEVRNILKTVNKSIEDTDIKIVRKNYVDYASVERMEDYEDENDNGTCDNGEEYVDENGNDKWGTVGRAGNGSARDAVLYSITVSYDSVFPLGTFTRNAKNRDAAFTLEGLTNRRTLTAETLLKNQPFGDQLARGAGENGHFCVDDDDTDDDSDYEDDYEDSGSEG